MPNVTKPDLLIGTSASNFFEEVIPQKTSIKSWMNSVAHSLCERSLIDLLLPRLRDVVDDRREQRRRAEAGVITRSCV